MRIAMTKHQASAVHALRCADTHVHGALHRATLPRLASIAHDAAHRMQHAA